MCVCTHTHTFITHICTKPVIISHCSLLKWKSKPLLEANFQFHLLESERYTSNRVFIERNQYFHNEIIILPSSLPLFVFSKGNTVLLKTLELTSIKPKLLILSRARAWENHRNSLRQQLQTAPAMSWNAGLSLTSCRACWNQCQLLSVLLVYSAV